MTVIRFQERDFASEAPRTVLESLAEQGIEIPSGCRAGVCQSCLMRCLEGEIPVGSQEGLKPALVAQGYFLACRARPSSDLTVALADAEGLRQKAHVLAVESLNQDIVALRLKPERPLDYRAGQYVRLYRRADLSRCYSLASVPTLDDWLELHIRRIPEGRVSAWVHDQLQVGMQVEIGDSLGQCFYTPGQEEQTLLLLGTGSGLAPLYGIVRDALDQGHRGPIWLYHGSFTAEGLYYQAPLQRLAARFPHFHYVPCVDRASPEALALNARVGSVLEVAVGDHPGFARHRVFLCGHPEMVKDARLKIFLGGASMAEIHADPFLPSGT
ncbi:2Fe-2S iron-sulfur cluster-binding protein [Ferrovum sp.]|uniref:2Fe-2S iron-sulfur cluster-binding protein n=1 Tax=Ferrovum sp. TaxID=2609467 RepID=UPI0026270CBE|nr:2Fe-2S iron-sulfur cluster-binding protein [Ferrovum sp.]